MSDVEGKRIEILVKAIEDCQQTIRFLDTKLTITTFFIGIYTAAIGAGIGDFSKYFWNMKPFSQAVFITLLCVVGLIIILEAVIIIITVFPTSNPAEHIDSDQHQTQNMLYVSGLNMKWYEYFKICRNTKLSANHSVLFTLYSTADVNKLTGELICELLKTSFIRELKINRIKLIKCMLFVLIILFPALLCFHYYGLSYHMHSC